MFAAVEQRIAQLEGRAMEQTQVFEGIRQTMADLRADMREHRQETSTAFRALDDKVSRYFMWMVGIQVTTLLTIIAVLARSR